MKQTFRYIFLVITSLIFNGCAPEYFDVSKFNAPDDLTPMIWLPVSTGDYLVKDYINIPETGSTPVNNPQIELAPITYDLTGLEFKTAAVDTLFIVVKTINASPMQLQYSLNFNDVLLKSPVLPGGKLDAAGHVTAPSEKSTTFLLSNAEFKRLGQASGYTLLITLLQPEAGPVIANDLKNGKITVKIAWKAPLNLLKL